MPRPNKPRTNGAESRFKSVVQRALDEQERSPAWLARHMSDAGCPTTPNTVWKMLNAGRTVYVDEAAAISRALGVPLGELLGA